MDGFVVDGGVDEVAGRGRRSTYLDVPGTTGHVVGYRLRRQTTCCPGGRPEGPRGPPRHRAHPGPPGRRERRGLAGRPDGGGGRVRRRDRCVRSSPPCPAGSGTARRSSVPRVEQVFAGSGLQRALEDLVNAPVLLDSDANAALLGILTDDATSERRALQPEQHPELRQLHRPRAGPGTHACLRRHRCALLRGRRRDPRRAAEHERASPVRPRAGTRAWSASTSCGWDRTTRCRAPRCWMLSRPRSSLLSVPSP